MFGVHVKVQMFCVAVGSGSHVIKGLNTSYWKISVSKLGSSHSTVGPEQLQGIYGEFMRHLRGFFRGV